MKRKLQLLLFPILIFGGFFFAFSARATIICPTATPLGVGCPSEPSQQYYCNSSCQNISLTYCPTNELTPVAPCSGLDSCGVCNACQSSYLLCTGSAYPTRSCTYNDPALHCASLTGSNCNAGQCASCVDGYTRCATDNTCITTQSCETWETFNACTNACEGAAPTLKLSFNSTVTGVTGTNILQAANSVLAISPSSFVGIGTTTPSARLEVIPTTGYSILAGNFKIGNVALPTTDADAATKGYVDSTVSSATSSSALWGGTTGGDIWSLNSGNVGIGTTAPQGNLVVSSITNPLLHIVSDSDASSGSASGYIKWFNNGDDGTGTQVGTLGYDESIPGMKFNYGGSANSHLVIKNGGNVGIGTTTPTAALSIVPASGYSILAGNFKIGNVALPTVDADAATKGYVDSTIASATSSITLWGGTTGGDIWNLNSSGNVGIGTTAPQGNLVVSSITNPLLHIVSDSDASSGSASGYIKWFNNGDDGTGTQVGTLGYDESIPGMKFNYGGSANSHLVIKNGGNVGIGTTAPATKLDLVGNITLRNTGTSGGFLVGDRATDPGQQMVFAAKTGAAYSVFNNFVQGSTLGVPKTSAIALWTSDINADSVNAMQLQLANNTTYGGMLFTQSYGTGVAKKISFQPNWDGTTAPSQLVLDTTGYVGIGTSTPTAKLSIVPASGYSVLAGNYKIGNVATPTTDADVVTLGWLNSALSSVSAVAVYSTSTPATYNGLQSGYTGANVLCAAVVTGSHVCTTGEIMNTMNTGAGSNIPAGTTLWISNGPPGYTANANDCMGWTSAVAGNYGTVWIKLATGDGFGSLNTCNTPRSFACCQ